MADNSALSLLAHTSVAAAEGHRPSASFRSRSADGQPKKRYLVTSPGHGAATEVVKHPRVAPPPSASPAEQLTPKVQKSPNVHEHSFPQPCQLDPKSPQPTPPQPSAPLSAQPSAQPSAQSSVQPPAQPPVQPPVQPPALHEQGTEDLLVGLATRLEATRLGNTEEDAALLTLASGTGLALAKIGLPAYEILGARPPESLVALLQSGTQTSGRLAVLRVWAMHPVHAVRIGAHFGTILRDVPAGDGDATLQACLLADVLCSRRRTADAARVRSSLAQHAPELMAFAATSLHLLVTRPSVLESTCRTAWRLSEEWEDASPRDARTQALVAAMGSAAAELARRVIEQPVVDEGVVRITRHLYERAFAASLRGADDVGIGPLCAESYEAVMDVLNPASLQTQFVAPMAHLHASISGLAHIGEVLAVACRRMPSWQETSVACPGSVSMLWLQIVQKRLAASGMVSIQSNRELVPLVDACHSVLSRMETTISAAKSCVLCGLVQSLCQLTRHPQPGGAVAVSALLREAMFGGSLLPQELDGPYRGRYNRSERGGGGSGCATAASAEAYVSYIIEDRRE